MKSYLAARLMALVLVVVVCAPVASLGAQRGYRPKPRVGEQWLQTELYFGTFISGGGAVTEEEFTQFLGSQITPRFPDGLTVITTYGQYRNSTGAIQQETTYLLILLYPQDARKRSHLLIEQIRNEYKSTFSQESVLRADSAAVVSF